MRIASLASEEEGNDETGGKSEESDETAMPSKVEVSSHGRLLPGLIGEYFTGHNFDHFITARIDSRASLDWSNSHPEFPNDHFSIRWRGWIVAPKKGRYVLTVNSDDGHRLWIDGKLVANRWNDGGNVSEVTVLLGDKHHTVDIAYYQDTARKYIYIKWRPEGGSHDEDLPPEVLFHTRGPLDHKSDPGPTVGRETLQERLRGTRWRNTNGVVFYWDAKGTLYRNGAQIEYEVVDDMRLRIRYGDNHSDTFAFDKDLQQFEQFSTSRPGKKPLFSGKRLR